MAAKKRIYLMGICGTGVGALAGLLKSQGHEVSGSDTNIYPPMSTKLEEWGIEVLEGWNAENLTPHPDLVIVGNVIRKTNPEARYVREAGLEFMSMPQAVAEFGIQDRHSIVVAGTHGKTTTTALISHLLEAVGRAPSFLVGGALVNHPESFRSVPGDFFVIEGDEYDTAYFDKVPKFIHYRPTTAIITSLEFDHADIYDSIEDIEAAFKRLVQLVPVEGHLVIWEGAHRAVALANKYAQCKVSVYGTNGTDDERVTMTHFETGSEGLVFNPSVDGTPLGEMQTPMWGKHSAQNVLAAVGALWEIGVTAEELRHGFAGFAGVKRRMEVIGKPRDIVVVDDFGHHPTAIRLTLEGAKKRWPNQRIWAFFEPRSATSRRNIFQSEFTEALRLADCVVVGSHPRLQEIPEEERFSPQAVAGDLESDGKLAKAIGDVDKIVEFVVQEGRPNDVLMIFSNGDFGGLHQELLRALRKKRAP